MSPGRTSTFSFLSMTLQAPGLGLASCCPLCLPSSHSTCWSPWRSKPYSVLFSKPFCVLSHQFISTLPKGERFFLSFVSLLYYRACKYLLCSVIFQISLQECKPPEERDCISVVILGSWLEEHCWIFMFCGPLMTWALSFGALSFGLCTIKSEELWRESFLMEDMS